MEDNYKKIKDNCEQNYKKRLKIIMRLENEGLEPGNRKIIK